MLQVGDTENQYAIDVRHYSSIDLWPLFDILEEKRVKIVGHNIKYDYKMLYTNYQVRLGDMMDTMIIEQVLNCGKYQYGYSLEKLTSRYLDFKYAKTNQLDLFGNQEYVGLLNKDTRGTFSKIGDKPFTYEQVIYGCKDVEHTLKIYFCQLEKIAEANLSKTVILESAFLRVLAHMELAGFHLDTKMWEEQFERNLKEYYKKRQVVLDYIKDKEVTQFFDFQKSLFETDPANFTPEVNINLSSSKQVIELCKLLGIPTQILDRKKSKEEGEDVFKDSVEEKVLRKYQKKYEIIGPYLEMKRFEKACTAFGHEYIVKHVNPVTGNIHSGYRQILDTGRIASGNPNLQQVPSIGKFPGFRECFRSKRGRLVICDYSQQESRVLADLANEEMMIHFFLDGDGDLHSHTARLMFKVPVSDTENKHLRQLAKVLNFG